MHRERACNSPGKLNLSSHYFGVDRFGQFPGVPRLQCSLRLSLVEIGQLQPRAIEVHLKFWVCTLLARGDRKTLKSDEEDLI